MKLFVQRYHDSDPGNPSYEIPGPLLFLHDDAILRRNEGRTQVFVPMQGMGGETWEELYLCLETALYVPVEGDRALVYRGLATLGGGTLAEPKVCRQIDIGVLYVNHPLDETWTQFPDLKTWWDSLDRAGADRRLAEAAPRYAALLAPSLNS